MTKHISILFTALSLLAFACKDHFEPAPPLPVSGQQVRFDQPEVGQISTYIRFRGPSCPGNAPGFQYLPDTLMLEVTDVQGELITCRERLTPGSACVLSPDTHDDPKGGGIAELTCTLRKSNGEIKLVAASGTYLQTRLFQEPSLTLPLAPIASPERLLQEWYPQDDGGNSGYLLNHSQQGATYPRLNVATYYGPMAWDGAGFLQLYAAEWGMVRAGLRSSWCQAGEGWDLK
ncbi:MAG TPA: hypothetical protein PKD78_00615 [Saprospiraceae bacterium]|nr:hypothetical protein [Saprospiraceae bacterium]HNG90487.1 hypothetical protein [Saprospiraceae bacterium]